MNNGWTDITKEKPSPHRPVLVYTKLGDIYAAIWSDMYNSFYLTKFKDEPIMLSNVVAWQPMLKGPYDL